MQKNLLSAFKIGAFSLATMCASCFAIETKINGDPIGTNFPKDAEGRVYHLGLKKGEVANNIILVGDPERAKLIATLLDHPESTFKYASNRGFTTYTGTKEGKPVTVMAIGMGSPMMDFAVREIRAITEGPLSIIRLGSCGTPREDVAVGTVVVANEAFGIVTQYEAYHQKDVSEPEYFHITALIEPDASLHAALVAQLSTEFNGSFPVVEAPTVAADSFYGSQGRIDPQFDDHNEDLIDSMMVRYPTTGAIEMETYHLFHLAKISTTKIRAAGCAIVLAQRKKNVYLTNDVKHELELRAGKACLEALLN